MSTWTKFEYDKLDRVTKKVTQAGTVYYAYDKTGLKTSLKDADLNESVYVYDGAGRLSKVELDAARTTYLHYDDSGMVVKKLLHQSKVQTYYTWDRAGRLEHLVNLDDSGNEITYFHYTRDENGAPTRIDRKTNGGEYHTLQYDDLDRLELEDHLQPSTPMDLSLFRADYAYDAAGNRTVKWSNYAGGDDVY
jgi:YD repeat-containing protein